MMTKEKLIERGWSISMIEKLLPVPDKTTVNRYSINNPIVSLYKEDKIEDMEKTNIFKMLISAYNKKQKLFEREPKIEKEEFNQNTECSKCNLPNVPLEMLIIEAIIEYDGCQDWRGILNNGFREAPSDDFDSDRNFFERISVNYIRNKLTDYKHSDFEQKMQRLEEKYGFDEAISILRENIYTDIANKYPELAEEAYYQLENNKWHYLKLKE